MKKKYLMTAAVTFALVASLGTIAGCASAPAKENVNANIPAGAPPLMPVNHADRFDDLGANGCYGCHGANDQANPMVKDAVAMPEDHYAGGSSTSKQFDPTHGECITCHAQA